jgi:hypothetical protein
LVLDTEPCAVAIAAHRVERISDEKDWPEAQRLPAIEVLVGLQPAPRGAARRVLTLGGPEGPVGLSIPHELTVLPATEASALPLPDLFGGKVFSAMLLWRGQPRALLVDVDRVRAQALEEFLRT